MPAPQVRAKNVLVLTPWTYRSGLIQTYTVPYVRLIRKNVPPGSAIHLVTLEQESLALSAGQRSAAVKELAKDGIQWRPFPYERFGVKALARALYQVFALLRLCRRGAIGVIHCFCTPAGTIGYVLSRLTGIPLIIDSYEPHAEAMVENGTWRKTSLAFRLLFLFEKLQSRRAATIIATTAAMRDYAKARYDAEFESFYVKPACVDLNLFKREGPPDVLLVKEYGLEGKLVCVYAGKTGGIYLKEDLFDLLKAAADYWGDRLRVLFLTSDDPSEIRAACVKSGLSPDAVICKFVEHRDMPRHLALADFALTPVKPVPTKRHAATIKDGEYWAMGLPVIITPNIADDSDIIEKNGIGSVLKDLSPRAYARSVREIDALLKRHSREELYSKIRRIAAETRGFARAEGIYREIYG